MITGSRWRERAAEAGGSGTFMKSAVKLADVAVYRRSSRISLGRDGHSRSKMLSISSYVGMARWTMRNPFFSGAQCSSSRTTIMAP
jgi:hypothetical protein